MVEVINKGVYLVDGELRDACAVAPAEAADALEAALSTAESVICFCISDQMSSTGNVFRLAVQDLEVEDKVFVIDSKNLSTGIGLQIIEAAILAEQGKDAKEIVIPDWATEVSKGAFEGCEELVSAIIPDTVKEIGEAAFKNCKKR